MSRIRKYMPVNQELIKQLSDQKYALDQAAIVAATDIKGVITYVNDKFCEISGYQREELIGKTHKILNSGTHPSQFFGEMWKTIKSGQTWRGEICNRKKTGELYWVYTTIVPYLDHSGKPEQFVSIRYEITELKEAKKVIEDQQVKLMSAARLSAVGELAAAVTHEINNPLGVILGRVEMLKSMLQEEPFNREDFKAKLDSIEVTALRIEKIVRGMRTLAHHQEDEAPSRISVKSVIGEVIDLCQHRLDKNNIPLQMVEIDPKVSIFCRSHQIVQVFVNLINNSVDAISNLSERWIKLEVQEVKNMVEIKLTDSGLGIAPEVREKMFNPFFSTKTVQYGTGLGLSVSQSLVEKNSGHLEYNTQSHNTSFVIRFRKA